MTPPDFIAKYFPELSSIDAVKLKDTRERIIAYMASGYPDLDMSQNSVFGDLVITPFAHLLAAHEEAMGRFMSDLDMENVANGIIYNCDFVRAYLGNFAVVDRANLHSTGVIRIITCADKEITIDRRTRYSFGTDNTFYLKLPHPGHFVIKPTDSSVSPNTNGRVLKQLDLTTWAVDIGVVGTMNGDPVLKGSAGATDVPDVDITGIVAVIDFTKGIPETSLPVLAEKTRTTFYSATLNTRNGARHFLSKEFPSLVSSSPVINNDDEQMREVVSALGIAEGKVDLFVMSNGFSNIDSQTVRMPLYNPVPSEGNPSRFIIQMNFLNPPCFIDSIVSATQPTIDLGFKDVDPNTYIISRSSNFAKAPLLQCAYSKYEDYFLCINMPLDDDTPLLTTIVGEGGVQFHDFTINYRSDPMVPVIADTVESQNVAPVGIDVLTKGFIVVVIKKLTISYVKTPGVTMALDTARNEIFNYFRTLVYNKVYSSSRIIDSMYYAGATEIISIVPDAYVQWTVADKICPNTFVGDNEDFITDWADVLADHALSPPVNTITTSADLNISYVDPDIGTSDETYACIGKRNVCYLLDKANIVFTEVIP